MRSFRAAVAAAALVSVAAATASVPSYADPGTPAPPAPPVLPVLPQVPLQAAEQALVHAEAVLTGEVEGDPTLALVELAEALPDLEGEDRKAAEGMLARPTNPTEEWEADYGFVPEAPPECGAHVCVHYVESGTHKGPDDDLLPPLGVPDHVTRTLEVMEQSWATEIDDLGYQAPRADGTRGNVATVPESSGKLDVYLAQLDAGFFGYAAPEADPAGTNDGNARTNTGHMVLDADFDGFSCEPLTCLQVTAAHEFFHIVQFGYDTGEDAWLMESTATWVEERVFDDANDNRNYVAQSSLRWPSRSLDLFNDLGTQYGNWVFHELYTQRLGVDLVRKVWADAARSGISSRSALDRVLRAHGSSLRLAFRDFAASSNIPSRSWSEGWAYPKASVRRAWTLSKAVRATGWQSVTLAHLSSQNFRFVPGDDLPGAWKLQVRVDAPNVGGTAYAIVLLEDGTVTRVPIPLGPEGNGTKVVAFSASKVARVLVNLGNAYAANNRVIRFAATVVS